MSPAQSDLVVAALAGLVILAVLLAALAMAVGAAVIALLAMGPARPGPRAAGRPLRSSRRRETITRPWRIRSETPSDSSPSSTACSPG
ncbi:MAG: hypothetical protein U0229_16440 [Anaeromyxobacter sp.]